MTTVTTPLLADALTGTSLTLVGLPGLNPLPWWQTLAGLVYAMIACLAVNDALKVAMIRWRVPGAVGDRKGSRASRPGVVVQAETEPFTRASASRVDGRAGAPEGGRS